MTIPDMFGDALPPVAPKPEPTAAHGAQTQSLYRKYRPQSFDSDDLVGQEHIVRTLRNAILLGRISHAYLFCGPRGTGKTTTARLLAKAVNCLHPDVMKRPCNECAACIAISTGATSDVIEIDAASNRGIDDIRDLRERVKYAPTQLQTKFYIIDEAHQITGAAANAFLKTLEEPPPHTKFVLATTDPEELLPTIVSRCQRFDFRRIGIDDTAARVETVAKAEGLTITPEALQTIARHATGSLRDAIGLLDQLAVYGDHASPDAADRTITVESVLALLGVSRNDRVERLVEALASRDAGLALSTVNDAVEAGEDPRQLNKQLVAYLRVLMHERAGGSPDADDRAKEFARRFDLPVLGRLARIFSETDYKIRHSPYAQLPLEIALVEAIAGTPAPAQMTAPSAGETAPTVAQNQPTARAEIGRPTDEEILSVPPTSVLKDKLRGGQRGGHLQVVPPAEPTRSIRETPPPIQSTATPPARPAMVPTGAGGLSVERLADLWPRIRNDVKAVNRRIEALLASIDPAGVNGNTIILTAAYDFHRKRMQDDEVRRVVEEAIARNVGQNVVIECVMRGELPTGGGFASAPRTPTPMVARDEPAIVPPAPPAPVDDDAPQLLNGSQAAPQFDANLDEQRLQAAKNIFDAEEIPESVDED